MTFQVIGKGRVLAGQTSSIKIEQIFFKGLFERTFLISNNVVDGNDVEITKNDTNNIFNDTIEQDEPDPAIVDSKKDEESKLITGWPDLEDGGIRTNNSISKWPKAEQMASAQLIFT